MQPHLLVSPVTALKRCRYNLQVKHPYNKNKWIKNHSTNNVEHLLSAKHYSILEYTNKQNSNFWNLKTKTWSLDFDGGVWRLFNTFLAPTFCFVSLTWQCADFPQYLVGHSLMFLLSIVFLLMSKIQIETWWCNLILACGNLKQGYCEFEGRMATK